MLRVSFFEKKKKKESFFDKKKQKPCKRYVCCLPTQDMKTYHTTPHPHHQGILQCRWLLRPARSFRRDNFFRETWRGQGASDGLKKQSTAMASNVFRTQSTFCPVLPMCSNFSICSVFSNILKVQSFFDLCFFCYLYLQLGTWSCQKKAWHKVQVVQGVRLALALGKGLPFGPFFGPNEPLWEGGGRGRERGRERPFIGPFFWRNKNMKVW